jgi:NitT/TauT family transport system permease protein
MSPDRNSARPLPAFSRMLGLTRPSKEDAIAFVILAGLGALFFHAARGTVAPLSSLQLAPVTLDPSALPYYALRTTLRMFAALFASTVFTLVVATLAARSRHAGQLIVPALDILQSIPIFGFLTFTVTFFMGLFPGSVLGAECVSIFTIFTSQAWNMAFSFYQSLRSIPSDLEEATMIYRLSPIRRFLKLDLPFGTPALVWNAMMSMSGSWFMVVASEAFTVGNTSVTLPGVGSFLALAIIRQNLYAVGQAVGVMAVVILAYDQLFFRPIVAWADRFRFEMTASTERPRSWVFDLLRRTRMLPVVLAPLGAIARTLLAFEPRVTRRRIMGEQRGHRAFEWIWQACVALAVVTALFLTARYILRFLVWHEVMNAVVAGCFTMTRVIVLIALASLIWVPIGVWVGLRPVWAERLQPVAQFLAAFPANVLYPFVVIGIVRWNLSPDVWLSPLMILGTQWYILFNVIAGASAIPTDLREAADMFHVRGWQWWRQVALPGIFPFYITGALTASGGSWNASVLSELVTWGHEKVVARGLGSYIEEATIAGDYARVALGIGVMSLFVIGFNRFLWRPLYAYGERRMRLT